MKITNKYNIDLPLAVWLMQDGYNSGAADAPPGELLSVTSLMKPVRQQILQRKVDQTKEEMDVSDMLARRKGHAFHDSIERSWTEGNWRKAMAMLNYPKSVIDKVVINPDPKDLKEDDMPIYLERRGFKLFEDIVLTGQIDFIVGNAYRDFKSTSTFAYTSGSKDKDYILQGSLYRYIFPEMITSDVMRIEFIFTDFVKYRTSEPGYPPISVAHKDFPLLSIQDTEEWLSLRLADIRANAKLAKKQDKLVRCTSEELWQSDPQYKYYGNPDTAAKGGRATKNFDNLADAELFKKEKGKGVVITKPGEVKACTYCSAFSVCDQRKEYFDDEGNNL